MNIAAQDFGFPHYISQSDQRRKLNDLFMEAFGVDAESYYDFYSEPFHKSALIANVKERKCLLISENGSSLKKVGEKIRNSLNVEVKELDWPKNLS